MARSPDEFLRMFLDPSRHHMQVVIQGDSGSGKSHLIRWIAINTPRTSKREVLVIPRAGMSLRSIVNRIIDVLPEDSREPYLKKLREVGSQAATQDQRRILLMDRIALAILYDPRRDEADDEEDFLIKSLPDLFHDPSLRNIFSRRGGVMDELLSHIFDGSQEYRRLEHERLFREEDLPLQTAELRELSAPARKVITQLLSSRDLVGLALAIINRNLPSAIPAVLQFTGEQLGELTLDIRRTLRKAGKELVLLIEDFATLQGIDRAILDQLIIASSRDNGLCDLRWAMAATHGYYEQVADTVQTRMDYVVDMDIVAGESGLTQDQIVVFAARYLNAVRLSAAELERWRTDELSADSNAPVPNACDDCSFRETCHKGFGEVNGLGLYPFTADAVINMAFGTDVRLEQRFNPRNLIKNVLREVLEEAGRYLESGRFPSELLLKRMHRRSELPALDDAALGRLNPDTYPRLSAVQALWSRDPREYQELPEAVYSAFGLKPVHLKSVSPLPPGGGRDSAAASSRSPLSAHRSGVGTTRIATQEHPIEVKVQRSVLETHLEAVDAWGRGDRMPQNTAQKLRDLLFPVLVSHIDWDRAGLVRAAFAEQRNGLFRNTSIIFQDQTTSNPLGSAITLNIPLHDSGRQESDERLLSAIALMGLLHFDAHQSWNFPSGTEFMVAAAESLERWSTTVLIGITRMLHGTDVFSPVPPAVEVLAVGATLAGKIGGDEQPLSARVNALFSKWPAPEVLVQQSDKWRELYTAIQPSKARLQEIVTSWACGSKGGQAGSYIDPRQILPTLEALQHGGVTSSLLPDGVGRVQGYKALADAHKKVMSSLVEAANREWERRTDWLRGTRNHLPHGARWAELVETLAGLRDVVLSHGIACRREVVDSLADALQEASGADVESLLTELEAIEKETDSMRALPLLSRIESGKTMSIAGRLLKETERFLEEVEAGLENARRGLEAKSQTIQDDQARIGKALTQLAGALGTLGGHHAR